MASKVTDSTFEEDVLKARIPVMVDFWADWCGPCRQLIPIVDELATEMRTKVKILKCNVDENPDSATKYGIKGIPALMLFKDGEITASRSGSTSKEILKEWIESSL